MTTIEVGSDQEKLKIPLIIPLHGVRISTGLFSTSVVEVRSSRAFFIPVISVFMRSSLSSRAFVF
jgi:uncharacterized membrane protein YqaE (UPF0057 family)